MNLFQTIWTALTTENELLTSIVGIPTVFLEAYVSMCLFTFLFNISATKKQKTTYVIIVSFIGIILRFLIPTPYSTYINIVAMLLAVMFIFKVKIFKAFLCMVVPFLFTAIIESIFARLYFIIFGLDYSSILNLPLQRFVITSFIYIMEFFIYLFIKYLKLSFTKLEILDKKKKVLLILNIIFGLILIGSLIYIMTFYANNIPLFIVVISVLSLITYFTISMYTIFTTSKLEETSMILEEEKLYNKTLQILHDNIRAFKHDFFNIVQGIGGYVGKEDMEGLKEYYAKLLEDCQQTNNLTALSPELVNNPAIYNILATKYHDADELGIKINLEVFMDLNELNINSYELTRILGILINNAIEASKECEEKVINISFRKDKRKHMQIISIENTYMDKDIDTEKIYEKGYSTKEGNTGIGLWEVRQILKKHNNLNLFTTKNDKFFSQQFEIYY